MSAVEGVVERTHRTQPSSLCTTAFTRLALPAVRSAGGTSVWVKFRFRQRLAGGSGCVGGKKEKTEGFTGKPAKPSQATKEVNLFVTYIV